MQYDSQPALNHHLSTRVTEILPETREVKTSAGTTVLYDVLILATGSDAVVPADTPGHDATGVFVYRNIADLERMISYSASVTGSTGLVVGGGLLGLEAAKAMMDLNQFGAVKLVDKNPWVLSRQLDRDAGGLVIEKVEELGLEVLKCHKIEEIKTDQTNQVVGVRFIDGKEIECSSICFAVSFSG